jgi:hypothetical protein
MKILKNIKYIIGTIAFVVLLNACDSYIEEDVFSAVTSENFITEDNADQLVVGIYPLVRGIYKDYAYKFDGTDIFTSKGDVNSISAVNDYVGFEAPNSDGLWTGNYNIIAKANTALNRYENQINWSNGRLAEKAYGIAQAKALRALAFFNLVQQYGGVVIDLEESQTIREDYARSTEGETFAQIIVDLEAAIPDLKEDPDTGRFSKRAAQHLLAEVYVTRAYTSFGTATDFTTAAGLAEQAIGSYDLRSQTFAQVFAYDNQVNDEVLFAAQWGSEGIPSDKVNNKHAMFMFSVVDLPGINRTTTPYGMSAGGPMPTPFFYSLFADNDSREDATMHRAILADGNEPDGPDNVVAGDTVVYFPKKALGVAKLTDRLNRYYVYQPDQYLWGRPADIPGVNYLYSKNTQNTNFPIFKKFDDEDFSENTDGSRDTFIYRIAETHLIAAEAYLGAGNASSAATHINRVRERATGVANHYGSVTIDDILNERALELAGETNRWAVLKRTGKLKERIEKHNPHVVNHGAFDANKHLLRPIPQEELNLSPSTMKQNPGYK